MLELTHRQEWLELPDKQLNEALIRRKDARINGRVYVHAYERRAR